MPDIENVVDDTPITSAWGNSVADGINDHTHDGGTGAGHTQVAHSSLTGVTATQHHAAAAAGPDADVTVDAAGAGGTAGTFARSGHGHRVNTSSATPAASTVAGTAGTSGTAPSRGDHAHPSAVPNVQVFTSGSGSWAKPAGARWVEVEVVGGGGGGGGCAAPPASQGAAGSGGGGGGYVRKLYAASALGSTEPYAVGAAGSAGSAGANNGGNGGNSTFSSAGNLLTGSGGAAGEGAAASAAGPNHLGGVGGAASGGDINLPGGDAPTTKMNVGVPTSLGNGASSYLSGGMSLAQIDAAGTTGKAYGGGGSGAASSASGSARAGGAGAAGVVIVRSYF